MSTKLDTFFSTDKSIRSTNFFNNRLLSAEDLNAEKTANRSEHKQLGHVMGDGIVSGLAVSVFAAEPLILTVAPGLAVNRNGRAFELTDPVQVELSKPANTTATAAPTFTEFRECKTPASGVYILNEGIYLLTIQPAEAGEGRAQVSGLSGASVGCNIKSRVSGVQFRLLALDEYLGQELSELQLAMNNTTASNRAAERNRQNHILRNRVAHRCLGTGDARLDSYITDPFGPTAADYGLLSRLRELDDQNHGKLTNCEVPLALVYWTGAGLQWLDLWSVRRQVTAAAPRGGLGTLFSQRRTREAEAMMMQFQAQLEDLRSGVGTPASLRAIDYFRHLPPVGLVPLTNNRFPLGFHQDLFFDGIVHPPVVHIEGARARAMLCAGLNYPAHDLGTKVMLWIYSVRENEQAAAVAPQASAAQPYFIFTSGHMAFMGDPHFDVNRWSFSNYA